MKRLRSENRNTPAYHDNIWGMEGIHWYDTVRLDAMLSPIKPGDRVLELGAGRFSAAEYALKERKLLCGMTAIDYSPTAREMTLEVTPELNYVLGDLFTFPFEPASFDVVMCGEVIEHLEEPEKLVERMAELVKIGGWATLTTVNEECEDAIKHGEYPEHIWSFTQDDLKEMFSKWFEKVEVGFVGNYRLVKAQK